MVLRISTSNGDGVGHFNVIHHAIRLAFILGPAGTERILGFGRAIDLRTT